jgi:hypothetical protein
MAAWACEVRFAARQVPNPVRRRTDPEPNSSSNEPAMMLPASTTVRSCNLNAQQHGECRWFTPTPLSTFLAIRGMEILPVHYMIARSGADNIRCAPYATFGTQELSDYAVKALQAGLVCLLAH